MRSVLVMTLYLAHTVIADTVNDRHETVVYVFYYLGTFFVVLAILSGLFAFTYSRMRRQPYYGKECKIIPSRYFANYAVRTRNQQMSCISIQVEGEMREIMNGAGLL